MRQRRLASIEKGADAKLVVRVYEQQGEDVERIAWRTIAKCGSEMADLLGGAGTPDFVPGRGSGGAI